MEKIEGVPDGWRLVRIGTPLHKEWFLDSDRKPTMANFDFSRCCMAIVERIKRPEPTYRPFANAAEFEPHRDKWITHQDSVIRYKVIAFDDYGIYSADGRFFSYSHLFESGTVFVNGSRPFGVEVTEA